MRVGAALFAYISDKENNKTFLSLKISSIFILNTCNSNPVHIQLTPAMSEKQDCMHIYIVLAACGGHLQATDRVKHLYSHSKYGDHNYENRADCDWSIEAEPGRNVHLTFLTFELEDEQDCGYDYVEVYSGLDASGPSYGRFCGNSVSK